MNRDWYRDPAVVAEEKRLIANFLELPEFDRYEIAAEFGLALPPGGGAPGREIFDQVKGVEFVMLVLASEQRRLKLSASHRSSVREEEDVRLLPPSS